MTIAEAEQMIAQVEITLRRHGEKKSTIRRFRKALILIGEDIRKRAFEHAIEAVECERDGLNT